MHEMTAFDADNDLRPSRRADNSWQVVLRHIHNAKTTPFPQMLGDLDFIVHHPALSGSAAQDEDTRVPLGLDVCQELAAHDFEAAPLVEVVVEIVKHDQLAKIGRP